MWFQSVRQSLSLFSFFSVLTSDCIELDFNEISYLVCQVFSVYPWVKFFKRNSRQIYTNGTSQVSGITIWIYTHVSRYGDRTQVLTATTHTHHIMTGSEIQTQGEGCLPSVIKQILRNPKLVDMCIACLLEKLILQLSLRFKMIFLSLH